MPATGRIDANKTIKNGATVTKVRSRYRGVKRDEARELEEAAAGVPRTNPNPNDPRGKRPKKRPRFGL